jgi:hypothetical protein
MSPEESIYAASNSANIMPRPAELVQRLALMRQLQASLFGSRNALLALDLAGIEQGTREQVELSLQLAEDIRRESTPAAKIRPLTRKHPASGLAGHPPELEPELKEEIRRSEREVLQALRLQSALLVRAQCKLRVLANMLAGPSVNYGPPLTRRGALPRAFRGKASGEI